MFSPVRVPLSFVFGLTLFQASCFSVFGWLLSKAFSNPNICPWYLVLTSLYGCETFALLTHWLGHRRIEVWPFSLWFEAHTIQHHVRDYPSKRFLSDSYKPSELNNEFGYVVAYLITPFVVSPWYLSSFLITYGVSLAMLRVADHIHMALHVKGHPWERLEMFQWFVYLRSLHYWHHVGDCKRNYAIGDFFLDFLLLGFKA